MIQEINTQICIIFTKTEVTKHVNKNNSDHGILFEAIRLALSLGEAAQENIIRDSIKMMAKFIGIREPNIRYTALEILSKATPQHLVTYPTLLKDNLNELLKGLKEPDISIRKAALDNLFMLATEETSAEIINELLDHI